MKINVKTIKALAQEASTWTKVLNKQSVLETKVAEQSYLKGMTFPELKPLQHDTLSFSPKKTIEETFENLLGRKLDIGTAKNAQAGLPDTVLNKLGWNHVLDDLNTELIRTKGNLDLIQPSLKNIVTQFDEAFKKVTQTTKDVICVRGEHYNPKNKKAIDRFFQFQNAKKGDVIGLSGENSSYAFFTDNLEYANHFANYNGDKKVIIKMLIPKGNNVPLNTYERGVAVLPRNVKYKILDIKKDLNSDVTVLVEYLK